MVIDLWWLSAGADTENLGAEWVIARPGAGPPDPNDADVPRWEAGLNLRAESDLIREFFTLATLRGGYLDPSTGQPVFSGAAGRPRKWHVRGVSIRRPQDGGDANRFHGDPAIQI